MLGALERGSEEEGDLVHEDRWRQEKLEVLRQFGLVEFYFRPGHLDFVHVSVLADSMEHWQLLPRLSVSHIGRSLFDFRPANGPAWANDARAWSVAAQRVPGSSAAVVFLRPASLYRRADVLAVQHHSVGGGNSRPGVASGFGVRTHGPVRLSLAFNFVRWVVAWNRTLPESSPRPCDGPWNGPTTSFLYRQKGAAVEPVGART